MAPDPYVKAEGGPPAMGRGLGGRGGGSSGGVTVAAGTREAEKAEPARRRPRAESMSLLVKSPRRKEAGIAKGGVW